MNLDTLAMAFRFIGDGLMISSRLVVIRKVLNTNSVSGLSLQTHVIYLCAYIFRYLELPYDIARSLNIFKLPTLIRNDPIFFYNTIMKTLFIAYYCYFVYLIAVRFRNTYNKRFDNFNLSILFIVAFVIGLFVGGETFSVFHYIEEYLYTVSLILEAVAILPQLVMVQEAGDCESLTAYYISMLGLYRLCYFVFFFCRYLAGHRIDMLILVTSLIQTGLYIDFFVFYYKFILASIGLGRKAN